MMNFLPNKHKFLNIICHHRYLLCFACFYFRIHVPTPFNPFNIWKLQICVSKDFNFFLHTFFTNVFETHQIFFLLFLIFLCLQPSFIWEQIKLTGILGFITALICILVTITTAIIHIQRLQSLKECEFTPKDSICTCYSQILGRSDAWTRSKEGEFHYFMHE